MSSAAADTRPVPAPDSISQFFWDGAAEGRLLIQKCTACGKYQYPPDVACTYCQCQTLEATQVSGHGALYAHVVADRTFHEGFVEHLPYVVALVELDEQPDLRMIANIVDCDHDQLVDGMRLEVTFERRGDITLPQFRPEQAR